MHRAEDRRTGRPVAQQFIEKVAGCLPRVIGIIKRLFGDIGVFIEPIDQGLPTGADNLDLRIMNMAVDKPRQYQKIRIPFDGYLAPQRWENVFGGTEFANGAARHN